MSGPRLGLSGGTLAAAIVALAIGGAVAGTATGARVAAEAAPPAELALSADPAAGPAAERPVPAQPHRVLGRVTAARGQFLRVRTPDGEVVRVHVLPRAVIRRAGEPASLEAVQRFDRVLAVGRVNQNGVLQARALRVQPTPLSRPWPADAAPPAAAPPDAPPAARPVQPGAARTAIALPIQPAQEP